MSKLRRCINSAYLSYSIDSCHGNFVLIYLFHRAMKNALKPECALLLRMISSQGGSCKLTELTKKLDSTERIKHVNGKAHTRQYAAWRKVNSTLPHAHTSHTHTHTHTSSHGSGQEHHDTPLCAFVSMSSSSSSSACPRPDLCVVPLPGTPPDLSKASKRCISSSDVAWAMAAWKKQERTSWSWQNISNIYKNSNCDPGPVQGEMNWSTSRHALKF